MDLTLLSKRGGEPEDDTRLLVKSLPGKSSVPAPTLKDVSKTVIKDLLDFLVQAEPEEAGDGEGGSDAASSKDDLSELPTTMASILSSGTVNSSRGPAVIRQVSNELIVSDKKEETSKETKESKEAEEKKKKRHLLPKSSICRLLAEMVKSYAGCAKLITEHQYHAGISDLVKEDCSALAFILDELLTSSSDKECASLVKMLVAALASCNHAPEAQTSLVTEVKNALTRSLSMTECSLKHTKVQALAGLISTMIEHCPAPSSPNQPPFKSGQVNMNNIVKCMVKKGIITDLARVTHALDLSSPSMANTVNAALKPLETLSRIVNQPSGLLSQSQSKPKPKPEESRASEANNVNTNTTNSEATRAQNDEIVGVDNEATEHDVSTAAESMDPNSESQLHTVEEGDVEEFDEMMDQLLDGERIGRSDGSQNMETEDTINDSQMMSHHEESFVEGDTGADDDSETDSSHSQESSAAEEDEDLEENEDDDEGDDDEDDDEDEDDDDAGSDNYGDEQDEYLQDSEDTFLRLPGTDREAHDVMMAGVIDDPFLDDRANNLPVWGEIGGGEGVTAGDTLAAGGAAGPSSVAPSHPLLMGRAEGGQHGAAAARGQGRSLTRQRGFRYIQLNPRSHGAGHGGNSQILQQLLGPSNGRDIFQFTESTRVLVMDSGFAILDSDEISGFDGIGQSSGTALSSIPSALVRWNEESRVLDGDSLHDCMTVCKPDILDVVEKHREEELAERREKKKKDQEEKDAVRKMDEEDTKKKEPEMATTPAPEAAGHGPGSADEMDVVVSENAAVAGAVDSISSAQGGSISDTAQRLAEDLAQAISSRVSGLPSNTTTTTSASQVNK